MSSISPRSVEEAAAVFVRIIINTCDWVSRRGKNEAVISFEFGGRSSHCSTTSTLLGQHFNDGVELGVKRRPLGLDLLFVVGVVVIVYIDIVIVATHLVPTVRTTVDVCLQQVPSTTTKQRVVVNCQLREEQEWLYVLIRKIKKYVLVINHFNLRDCLFLSKIILAVAFLN